MNLLAQISLPSDTAPGKGSLWNAIFGPIMPLLEGLWWVTLHLFIPLGLIAGVVGMIVAGIAGNRMAMARARGAIMAIPMAVFLASAAVLVGNWVLTTYA